MELDLESQERPPRNLRTHPDETKQAMARVERGGWLKTNERIAAHWNEASEGERSGSFSGALEWLGTVAPDEDTWRVIYGDGGMNRWYVHADGRVRFSRFHAMQGAISRAEAEGFWVG